MPRKPQPDPEVIDLLERWLADARSGDLRDVVLVGRFCDGEYADDWIVNDQGDMAVELRSTVIRMQIQKDQIDVLSEH